MKKLFVITCLILGLCWISQPARAENITVDAPNAIAVDVRTGKILYEKNADELVPVANLSRLMTIYLTYQAVADGKVHWNDQVAISDYAYNLTFDPSVPNIPLEARSYTLQELTKASIISASTSASIAMAEHVAGSEANFVKQMRKLSQKWELSDNLLVNASGINNLYLGNNRLAGSRETDENQMTARDLAIASYHLVNDFPEVLEFTKATRGQFPDQYLHTYNYLLENMPYERANAYGLLTGSSEQSGSSLISLSYENYMQVLTVLVNVNGGAEDPYRRFEVAHDFLDQIGENFHLQKVWPGSSSFYDTKAPVLDGKDNSVPVVTLDDFYVVTTPATKNSIELVPEYPDRTNFAPIKEEDVVGKLVFQDQTLIGQGYLGDLPSMELIADQEVQRANLFKIIWNHFVRYVLDYL